MALLSGTQARLALLGFTVVLGKALAIQRTGRCSGRGARGDRRPATASLRRSADHLFKGQAADGRGTYGVFRAIAILGRYGAARADYGEIGVEASHRRCALDVNQYYRVVRKPHYQMGKNLPPSKLGKWLRGGKLETPTPITYSVTKSTFCFAGETSTTTPPLGAV